KGFDDCVTWGWSSFGLKALLEHGFVVGFGCTLRVGARQLIAERVTDKPRGSFEPSIEKDRSRDCFKHVREQCILLSPAALLFATTESHEVAQVKHLRSLSQRWGADEAVLHTRQFTFGATRIRVA